MEITLPDDEAWVAADTLVIGSAISWPFRTYSPSLTIILGIFPTCCLTGMISFFGMEIFLIGFNVEIFLWPLGLIPPKNLYISSLICMFIFLINFKYWIFPFPIICSFRDYLHIYTIYWTWR